MPIDQSAKQLAVGHVTISLRIGPTMDVDVFFTYVEWSIAVRRRLTATGTHVPYGITQYYLPPGRGDIPAVTPAEAGTRFSDPGGMQG